MATCLFAAGTATNTDAALRIQPQPGARHGGNVTHVTVAMAAATDQNSGRGYQHSSVTAPYAMSPGLFVHKHGVLHLGDPLFAFEEELSGLSLNGELR